MKEYKTLIKHTCGHTIENITTSPMKSFEKKFKMTQPCYMCQKKEKEQNPLT